MRRGADINYVALSDDWLWFRMMWIENGLDGAHLFSFDSTAQDLFANEVDA